MIGSHLLISMDALMCQWGTSKFLLFSDNVFSPIIYYSHLVPTTAGLLLAFIIWRQKEKLLINKLFITIALLFSTWCLFDLILWAHESPNYIMFFWSALIYIEPIIYFASAYLLYVFVTGKDISLLTKFILFGLLLPVIILAPTSLNLTGFDYTNCDREALEGPLWYYVYFIEGITVLWIIYFALKKFFSKKILKSLRIQTLLLGGGLSAFLLAFSWGNIVGSFSEDWSIAQYGLFGMPILLGAIIYLIVQFQTFKVRILGVTALIVTLWILLFSILFLQSIESARPIIIVTLLIFAFIGALLIRGVHREIEQKEEITKLAKNLEGANVRLKELDKAKSEFLSIASHQLRTPLAAIRGYLSMMQEGDFGKPTETMLDPLQKLVESGRLMNTSIEDYLNASRIEQGRMVYAMQDVDLISVVKTVTEELTPSAVRGGLTLTTTLSDATTPKNAITTADLGKIKQVISNIIDNAIKYTKQGGITVSLTEKGKNFIITVTDTGVGIDKEEISKLFSKFTRAKDAGLVNTSGTGLGLYVAKQIIEAHKGSIRIESDGVGKGSRFIVEIPKKTNI